MIEKPESLSPEEFANLLLRQCFGQTDEFVLEVCRIMQQKVLESQK